MSSTSASAGSRAAGGYTIKAIDEMESIHHGAATLARAEPCVVERGENLWFLGTLARMKLEGHQTGGRFALWEAVMPHGAAPPLHSHPQDETFYVLEGEVVVWLVEPELAGDETDPPAWVETRGRRCAAGTAVFAPGGTPHTFRVESDTARMLVLSTPGGIEDMVRGLSEPARWPWLQSMRFAGARVAAWPLSGGCLTAHFSGAPGRSRI